jgi:hypothetical protein
MTGEAQEEGTMSLARMSVVGMVVGPVLGWGKLSSTARGGAAVEVSRGKENAEQ